MKKNHHDKLQREFKNFIIIIGLAIIALLGGSFYTFDKMDKDLPDIHQVKQQIIADANEFATKASVKNCIDESLFRIKSCDTDNLNCRITVHLFLKQCLTNAKSDAGFCQGIGNKNPASKKTGTKTGSWKNFVCNNHPEVHNMVCTAAMGMVEQYCSQKNNEPAKQ